MPSGAAAAIHEGLFCRADALGANLSATVDAAQPTPDEGVRDADQAPHVVGVEPPSDTQSSVIVLVWLSRSALVSVR